MPSTPASSARSAAPGVSTPFSSSGSELIDRIHATIDQSSADSIAACACAAGDDMRVSGRFAGWMCGGSRKPLRRSRSLLPRCGASTVSISASMPDSCASSISRRVSSRSRKQYSCNHSGEVATGLSSLNARPANVLSTTGTPTDPAACTVASSPSGCTRLW